MLRRWAPAWPWLALPASPGASAEAAKDRLTGLVDVGGLYLRHYAGYGSWKVGLMMVALGAALVSVIIAFGE